MIRLLSLDSQGDISLKPFEDDSVPKYAILSHTWSLDNDDELSYIDVLDGDSRDYGNKPGCYKVLACLQQAAKDSIMYCWVDTCCIDKRSSQELSEAIISMFRWYEKAAKCYAYLSDVSAPKSQVASSSTTTPSWKLDFARSRWFTRGWTLQELLAPLYVDFFSSEWKLLGDKRSLERIISQTTKIPVEALRFEKPLNKFSIEERQSWIRSRMTKRPEDKAYCMFGILRVWTNIQYGIGETAAFDLLNEAVRKASKALTSYTYTSVQDSEPENNKTSQPEYAPKPLLDLKQLEVLRSSLTFDEIEVRRITIRAAHPKTCRWLLDDPSFAAWLNPGKQDDRNGFLWIKGKPGSGKSTIMKFALEHAQKTAGENVLLSFFFNARGTSLEKSVAGAYRTLLTQLLIQKPSLQSIFHSTLGIQASKISIDHEWDINTLQALIIEAISGLNSTAICFIDALDESDEKDVRDMVAFLENICQQKDFQQGTLTQSCSRDNLFQQSFQAQSCFRVCFASRHYPHITVSRGLEVNLDIEKGHEEDIVHYLTDRLRIGHGRYEDQIRSEVLRKSAGVFLWIVLVINILNQVHDHGGRSRLQQELAEIPDDIYRLFSDTLTRDSDNMEATKLCIQWILFAQCPLEVGQLYQAIKCGTEGFTSLVRDFSFKASRKSTMQISDEVKYILAYSKGLAQITRSRPPQVQFIHETVRDFLLKEKGFEKIWPDDIGNTEGFGHERLKQCCESYLNGFRLHIGQEFDISGTVTARFASRQSHCRQEEFPLLIYMNRGLLYHADQASRYGVRQTNYLSRLGYVDASWIYLSNTLNMHCRISRLVSRCISVPYFLVEMEALHLLQGDPNTRYCLQMEDQIYGNALFAAVALGNKKATIVLLKALVDKDRLDNHANQLLVQLSEDPKWQGGFDTRFVCQKGTVALLELAKYASDSLWDFALYTGIATACADNPAVNHGFLETFLEEDMRLIIRLVSAGVDINALDSIYPIPLHIVSNKGDNERVQTLLDLGADINAQREPYYSALWAASSQGHLKTVRLLLDRGADVNAQCGQYGSALQAACTGRSLELKKVQLSLNRSASIDEQENNVVVRFMHRGRLFLLKCQDYLVIIETLLDRGADIDAQVGLYQSTVLQEASQVGDFDLVQLLLRGGARKDLSSKHSTKTALYLASEMGHAEIVQLLLDVEEEIDTLDRTYAEAIEAASDLEHDDAKWLLEERLFDVNYVDPRKERSLPLRSGRGFECSASGQLQ